MVQIWKVKVPKIQISEKAKLPIKLTPNWRWIYLTIGSLIAEILLLTLLEIRAIEVDAWFARYILIVLIVGTAVSIRGINKVWADSQKIVIQNAIIPFFKTEIKWKEITKARLMVESRVNDLKSSPLALESIILWVGDKKIYISNYYDLRFLPINWHYKVGSMNKEPELMKIVSVLKRNGIKIEERIYARSSH